MLLARAERGATARQLADGHSIGQVFKTGPDLDMQRFSSRERGEPVPCCTRLIATDCDGIAARVATLGGMTVWCSPVGSRELILIRRRVVKTSGLGLLIDGDANAAGEGDRQIGRSGATAFTTVVTAREDLQIAREVRLLMGRRVR